MRFVFRSTFRVPRPEFFPVLPRVSQGSRGSAFLQASDAASTMAFGDAARGPAHVSNSYYRVGWEVLSGSLGVDPVDPAFFSVRGFADRVPRSRPRRETAIPPCLASGGRSSHWLGYRFPCPASVGSDHAFVPRAYRPAEAAPAFSRL